MEQTKMDGAMRTMVCVTAQRTCERLIRAGSEIARGGDLCVVHVAPMDAQFLDGTDDAKTLEFLYRIVREFDAEMTVEHNDRPLDALEAQARRINAQCVVLGASGKPDGDPFAKTLGERLPGVTIHIVK
jgi:K+-sensing histidine kinase KdpD